MFDTPRRSIALLFTILVCFSAQARTPDAAEWHDSSSHLAESPWIEAIWHTQDLHLHYQSFTSRYSCKALEHKVAEILQALGAHVSLAIDSGCAGTHLTGSARLRIAVASPVAATQRNVARATSYDGREQLIARLRGIDLPQAADVARFPAQWETFLLTSQRAARLSTADCDLLFALNDQVFPHLGVRLDRRAFSCSSTASRVRPHVVVTALRPVALVATAQLERDP